MSWRFWQKAYFATLILFLAALFGGVFGMAYVSWQQSFSAQTDKAIGRQQLLAQVIEGAVTQIKPGHEWTLPALYEAYGKDTRANGGTMELIEAGEILYSNLPPFSGQRPELAVENGEICWVVRRINEQQYLYVSSVIADGALIVTRTQNITELISGWQDMILLYVTACVLVSAVFAISLFFILRGLSRPLDKLTHSAQRIAAGGYDTRVPVKGRDDVAQLSASFNDMAGAVQQNMQQLKEAAQQKQRLIDNLSHEMRTPTTAIQGYAEYVQQAAVSPEQAHAIMGRIQNETLRLKRIVERMLSLSAMEHSPWQPQPVLLHDIFAQALNTLGGTAKAHGVSVSVRLDSPALSVTGDATLLESLVVNLAENAIKACGQNGRVLLAAKQTAAGVLLQVCDDGQGMTPEQLAHLGEAFYRVDTARSRADGGAGLGVALCFEIVRLHGGRLVYRSQPGKGTVANVTFSV